MVQIRGLKFTTKTEGPGRGWWGPPKGTHVAGGGIKITAPNRALSRMVPSTNLHKLKPGPNGGLQGATIEGRFDPSKEMPVKTLMYNSKTDTLVMGGEFGHSHLHTLYAPNQNYDDFVKMHLEEQTLYIYLDRHVARDKADAWNMMFKAAKAMKSAGLPDRHKISLEEWASDAILSELEIGEI